MAGCSQNDLAALTDLDEEILLESLSKRFKQDCIYTYIGDILVAMNPYKYLPLYEKDVSEQYKCHEKTLLPPHIFAVADQAYQSMLGRLGSGPRNQCIVISGESGAGKTESTKLLLKHMMDLCRANCALEQQILQLNPLLEAFGNSQTLMNDNSSRFGKYIQLRFHNSSVRGAKINEYLLEKSRVVHQDVGEQNFHIFYFMLAGIRPEDKEVYGLLEPTQYRYLNCRFGTEEMVCHWSANYNKVCNAMDMVGFEDQEKFDMMTILAGILSLGNVVFQPTESDEVRVSEPSLGWLKASAGQFGVQEGELVKSLTCTMSVARGESIRRSHNQQQAEDARDSIAKAVYARVFGWIVRKMNELLAPSVGCDVELTEIGILDIFGFENFAVNRFEQICINVANEQLQYFFNHHIFLMEQKEYEAEGMPWETVAFKDNKPILDLFLAKPFGFFSLLDEQSAFPQATDRDFVYKLYEKFKGNPHLEAGRSHNPVFTIVHYAGKVQYNGSGFLEKNRDTIPASIRGLFVNSVTTLLSVLFAATISRTGTLMPRNAKLLQGGEDNFNSTRKQSVGAQFRHSLAVLMEKMFAANPHFVRCIKPNAKKQPDNVDDKTMMDQLRYNGLLETVRIRRHGFSWRPSFKEFAQRYGILLFKPDLPLNKESCMSVLNTTELCDWKCGFQTVWDYVLDSLMIPLTDPNIKMSTRLFFKYWHQEELARLLERLNRVAVVIQKNFRAVRCRRRYVAALVELRRLMQQRLEEEQRIQQQLEQEMKMQLEQENKRPVSPPVPLPRLKKPQPKPRCHSAAGVNPVTPVPVPRPRSKYFEATPFDNKLMVNSDSIVILPTPGEQEKANERGSRRRNTIRWFRETQARKVVKNGAFPCWFHGMITRRQAENLLMDKPLGCFLIRVGQSREGYTLTYRALDRCRHYMIEMQSNGRYLILGEDRAHASLPDLVDYHTCNGIKPFMELLTVPCGQACDQEPDYEELKYLLDKGLNTRAEGSTGPEQVRLELQQLFVPPGQSYSYGDHKPAVRKKTSNSHVPTDTSKGWAQSSEPSDQGEGSLKMRPLPRLYPSIRLAMAEIQQRVSANPD